MKSILIKGNLWKIKRDNLTALGAFDFGNYTITIDKKLKGVNLIETLYHEILEILMVYNKCRYNPCGGGDVVFLFSFTHDKFQVIVQDFVEVLIKNKMGVFK